MPDARSLSDDVLEALRVRAVHGCELGFTQADVAAVQGVSQETVSRWWTAHVDGGPDALPGDRTGRPVGSGRTLSDDQERSLLGSVLETVQRRDVWIADRNFCTTDFLFGIDRRDGGFVIRRHGATLFIESMGRRRRCGPCDAGQVFEQEMRLGDADDDGGTMTVRRITVVLDTPTRDGETEVHILTNLPADAADALVVAGLYRRRWTVEAAFGELATCLNGEVDALGCPKAALFAFCVASASYNVMSVVKAALRSAHGEEAVEGLSFYYLADEVAGTHRGMMIVIPEDRWAVFHGLTAAAFGGILLELASGVRLSVYRKQVRGTKRPPPKRASGAKIKHVSTAKPLEKREGST